MTVALHGMLNTRNFGDVLLADIVAIWLRKAGYDVVAPFSKPDVAVDLGVKKPGGYAQLRGCSHMVYCGGGYFGLSPNRPVRRDLVMVGRYAMQATLGRLLGVPYSVIGVGVSNLNEGYFKGYMRHFFSGARLLAVRDMEAEAALRELGVRRQVETLSDIVLTLTPDQVPSADAAEAGQKLGDLRQRFSQVIGLHISEPPETPRYQAMFDALAALAQELPDAGFLLLEDHPGSDASTQRKAMRALEERIAGRTVSRPYRTHWDMVATIGQLDGLITNKLHTSIVASALNRPALAVAKHHKNRFFFKQIGQSDRCFDIAGFDQDSFIQRSLEAFRTPITEPIVAADVRARANRNRELLLEALA